MYRLFLQSELEQCNKREEWGNEIRNPPVPERKLYLRRSRYKLFLAEIVPSLVGNSVQYFQHAILSESILTRLPQTHSERARRSRRPCLRAVVQRLWLSPGRSQRTKI